MSNYDLRAREWNQRMKDADPTRGEPVAPEPLKTVAHMDSIYVTARSKSSLLDLAAYYFIHDLPFPKQMRSDFVRFRVTPDQFEERTYVMLLKIDLEFGLPKEANRPEIGDLLGRWNAKPSEPITAEKLKTSTRIQAMDKHWYMQLYEVPMMPKEAPESLGKFADLLSQSISLDPFAIHTHGPRDAMFRNSNT